jgi:hypothetical protein
MRIDRRSAIIADAAQQAVDALRAAGQRLRPGQNTPE